MLNKKIRKVMASVMAVALLAGSVSMPAENVFAGEVLGETGFENKYLPWRGLESAPANQNISVEDGQLRVEILNPTGECCERWDLRTEYRNIKFKKGHEYTVSFKAKSNRSGLQLCTHIGNVKGDEEYFVLSGDKMQMGPHMDGQWGKAAVLETEYQTFSGTFIPTEDIEGAVWTFQYARGTVYEGNAQSGDEIWFDDMSIICETCEDCNYKGSSTFPPSVVNRERSAHTDPETYAPDGKLINFISVNQLGYYPGLKKVAVLADNKGDVFSMTSSIDLTESSYEFEVCDAATDEVKFKGVSGEAIQDQDSGDTVFKLDFTEFNEPGKYYIKAGEWRSFEFEISDSIYSSSDKSLLTDALNYFYQNRSGIDIDEKYITSGEKALLAHEASHKVDEAYIQTINGNSYTYSNSMDASKKYASSVTQASGGWYMTGQNHSKQVVVGGISVWTLQNMYERASKRESGRDKFADGSGKVVIPEAGNKVPDILDEAAYEIDWMTNMVVKEDEPTWGKYAGMVYRNLKDHKWTGLAIRPYDYEEEWGTVRIVNPPTFDATLNYVACSAQAARLWQPYDSEKAAYYLESAKKSYEAYKTHWEKESDNKDLYDWVYDHSVSAVKSTISDEAYWAACELFVTAKTFEDASADEYYKDLSAHSYAFNMPTAINIPNYVGTSASLNVDNTTTAGSMTLYLNKEFLPENDMKKLEESIISAADMYTGATEEQGYGIPYVYDSSGYREPNGIDVYVVKGYANCSNLLVLTNSMVMAYAYDITEDAKYVNGVVSGMDYILGTNPLNYSYITGYGDYSVENPNHRYWAAELDKTLPSAPDGVLVGGPDAGLHDEYVRGLGMTSEKITIPSQRCYVDDIESWSTNGTGIDTNAALAWVVSFIEDEAKAYSKNDGNENKTPEDNKDTTDDENKTPEDNKDTTDDENKTPEDNKDTTDDENKTPEDNKDTTGDKDKTPEDNKDTTGDKDKTPEDNKDVTDNKNETPEDNKDTSDDSDKAPDNNSPVVVPTATSTSSIATEIINYGDMNGDGETDLSDLTLLSLHLIGDKKLTDNFLKAADVYYDGEVNIADLAHFKQYISKEPNVVLGVQK